MGVHVDGGNTAIGFGTLAGNDDGRNTAVGLGANASGISFNPGLVESANTAIGANTDAASGGSLGETRNTAIGRNANASGVGGLGNTAIGTNARASVTVGGVNQTVVGASSHAQGIDASAVGGGATATHNNSAAFGQGATTTRSNQQVFGTGSNTYTMPGVTSAARRSAQGTVTGLITTSAAGNLASDGGALQSAVNTNTTGVATNTNNIQINANEIAGLRGQGDINTAGVAIALAVENPDLKGMESFGILVNGSTFNGSTAIGGAFIGSIAEDMFGVGNRGRLAISAGVGYSLEQKEFGARGGLQLTW